MTKYYFVRHGESTANVEGVIAGWSDVSLTEKGVEQAKLLANELAGSGITFDLIVSSPLRRAYDTAMAVAEVTDYPGREIVTLPDLREIGSGALELSPLGVTKGLSDKDRRAVGAETVADFEIRIRNGIEELRCLSTGRDSVLVVGHSGVYRLVTALANGQPALSMKRIDRPPNATMLPFPIENPLR